MTPTVLREKGYRVMIYTHDHPPAHVHVVAAGKEAKVSLDPIAIIENGGYNRRELSEVASLVERNREFLLMKWDEYHQERHEP